ncbi:hypothetical protein NVP1244A_007 [Vibrio phage 1.244.A._10N.261.54.C3]|nr:hypothetical protein NVP1244A_007 [Vibrio phage 1.244.A._10N.261.54.C3]AUR98635.1 hypothetical protein NVP1255O_007 [Vibrio phage 1.255.O._10N.286.45.F1]
MELELVSKRVVDGATLGDFYVDGEWVGFTLEDGPEGPEGKIDGKTRIPRGRYPIKFREVLSGKTKQYRNKAKYSSFFTWHLELQDVPNYEYVYIHAGNTPEHTLGCILVGYTQEWDKAFVGRSGDCFSAIYKRVQQALVDGDEVWITVQ